MQIAARRLVALGSLVEKPSYKAVAGDSKSQTPVLVSTGNMRSILVLPLLAVCLALTSGQRMNVNFLSRLGSNLARSGLTDFLSQSGGPRTPTCQFDVYPVPETKWADTSNVCLDPLELAKDPYDYFVPQMQQALAKDPWAQNFLSTLVECYQGQQENYYGSNPGYRFKDMCEVKYDVLTTVYRKTAAGTIRDKCYVVNATQQAIKVAVCGRNCQFDATTSPNHFCVPDGFVTRSVLVFCPGDLEKQCQAADIKVPVGCACKKYECFKFAK